MSGLRERAERFVADRMAGGVSSALAFHGSVNALAAEFAAVREAALEEAARVAEKYALTFHPETVGVSNWANAVSVLDCLASDIRDLKSASEAGAAPVADGPPPREESQHG